MYVHKSCSTKGSALHKTECIEWMPMTLIASISHLDKYDPLSISCDDIDLSSLDLVISLDDFEPFSFEVLHCKFFSLISDASSGRFFWFRHCEHSEAIQRNNDSVLHWIPAFAGMTRTMDCFVPRNDRHSINLERTHSFF